MDNLWPKPPSGTYSITPLSTGSNSDYFAIVLPGETNTTYFFDGQSPFPQVTYLTYSGPVIVKVTALYEYYVATHGTWHDAISYTIP